MSRVAGSSAFAKAVGVTVRVTRSADRMVKAQFARTWHLVNLPAASDVRRLREMVADLDRELQRVQRQLEAQEGGRAGGSPDSDGSDARPRRSARADTAGRAAERPESA